MTSTMIEAKVALALAPLENEHIISFAFIARSEKNGAFGGESEIEGPLGTMKTLLAAIIGFAHQNGMDLDKLPAMLAEVRTTMRDIETRAV